MSLLALPLQRGAAGSRRAADWLADSRMPYVLAALQGAWLWWAYGRGWFLQADLSNLVDGVGQRPTWGYLSNTLGGHFSPITRLVYWFLDEVSPLDYGLSIVLRVAFQAAATIVLYRLLLTLTGRARLTTVIVALYAFNPMLLAGTAMFTPGITIQIGQLLVLLALVAHVRYERGGALRNAVVAGVSLALAVLSSEQWIVAAAAFPLLSLVRLYDGGSRERLRTLVRHWRGWLCLAVPFGIVVVAAATMADPVGVATPSVTASYRLLRNSWLNSIAPSWIGGPFQWFGSATTYLPFSSPSDLVVIVGQLGVAATVLVGLQRGGRMSLLGWIIPVVCWAASMLLVGYRGFASYQLLVAITPRYLAALIVFFAIGAALALSPVATTASRATSTDPPPILEATAADPADPADPTHDKEPAGWSGIQSVVAVAVIIAVLISSLVSGARYAAFFAKQPAEAYVNNLQQSAQLHSNGVNIYNTSVPNWLITGYEPNHHVADLLRLAGVKVAIESSVSTPLIAALDGRLVNSVFVAAGASIASGQCGNAIRGSGTFTFTLNKVVPATQWWLHLVLFQQKPSTVQIELVAANGHTASPVAGESVTLGSLAAVSLRLPAFPTAAVRFVTTSPDTNICLPTIQVGAPFPVTGR